MRGQRWSLEESECLYGRASALIAVSTWRDLLRMYEGVGAMVQQQRRSALLALLEHGYLSPPTRAALRRELVRVLEAGACDRGQRILDAWAAGELERADNWLTREAASWLSRHLTDAEASVLQRRLLDEAGEERLAWQADAAEDARETKE